MYFTFCKMQNAPDSAALTCVVSKSPAPQPVTPDRTAKDAPSGAKLLLYRGLYLDWEKTVARAHVQTPKWLPAALRPTQITATSLPLFRTPKHQGNTHQAAFNPSTPHPITLSSWPLHQVNCRKIFAHAA